MGGARLAAIAILVAASGGSPVARAEPKAYTYIFEKKMPRKACLSRMKAFAKQRKLVLEKSQEDDFYLNDASGERVGNAYYAQGGCYIYLD